MGSLMNFESLIIGDLQLEEKTLKKGDTVFEIIESMNPPQVILLGDLLERRGLIESSVFTWLFNKLRASPRKYIIINGNHDLVKLREPISALQALKALPNVTLVDEPQLIGGYAFIPYIHNQDELKAAIQSFKGKTEVGFGHLDIIGMDYGNGMKAENGIKVDDIFSVFKTFVSGHFHKFQKVVENHHKFYYLGGPYSHDWGEVNQDKFIAEFKLDDLKLIPTNDVFPRHVSITIDTDSQDLLTEIQNVNLTDYNRITLTGSVENIEQAKKELTIIGLDEAAIYEAPNQGIIEERVLSETMTLEEQFVVYAEQIAHLPEKVIRVGLDILEEV